MATNDPFAAAVDEAERGFVVYGQIQVSAAFVVLRKGQPKSAWVEGHDTARDRSTEVSMVINPIEQTGFTKLVNRSMIAGNTGEFANIVWPSLRDGCGIKDLRELDNKFVKAELVKNGRKWTKRDTGEEQEGTTFKFHAVYLDEAACIAGFEADGNTPRASTGGSSPAMDVDMSPGAGTENPERETAWSFVQTLAKQANGDKNELTKLLAGMPFVTKHFTVDSPEVAPLLKAA